MKTHQINKIYYIPMQNNLVTYIHQRLFSATKGTLLKSIKNNKLLGFPGLTEISVTGTLPHLTETIK